MKICSVDGCDRSKMTKGLCNKHYKRLWRYGDPRGGGTPQGEPYNYFVNVVMKYTGDDCIFWPYGRNDNGYGQMAVKGKGRPTYVHRYACEQANGPPPEHHDAAHSCGRGHLGCVNPNHLSWKTRAENFADKIIHGTHVRGDRHPASKLTEQQVREIVALKGKETQAVIAKKYGIGQTTVSHIMRGESWGWLSKAA